MAHQALARRYRPRTFADVATQEHVSETLRRAVARDRVGHAYLFCGPRGVGQTTLARVLAMALNCPHRTEDGEPCGTCESCRRIWSGHTSLDVVEIDAATNRGVDDARELRERAMYAPSEEERFKVYIVDEAHMLTREAWNALLKILEEPPPRVIFVFATTEPQKIQQSAAPILSRCQRFDFRRIGTSDIVARLEEVLEGEGTGAPAEALRTIARKADGGMRDALSLLDQVLALTEGEVSPESVRRILGLVEEERYLQLMDLLAEGRHGEVFSFVEELLHEGYDLVEFYHGLVEALRILLRVRLDEADSAGLSPEIHQEYRERAGSFEPGDLIRMLAMAAELETSGSLRRSAQPRMLVELLLLRYSSLDRTVSLEELLRGLGGGGGPAGGPEARSAGRDEAAHGATGGRGETSEEARRAADAGSTPGRSREGVGRPAGGETSDPGSDAPSGSRAPPGSGPTAVSIQEALERVLERPEALPPGMRMVLRAGRISRTDDGTVRLSLPSGPGLERLQDPVARRNLARALGRHLGSNPELVVEGAEESTADQTARISRDTLKRDRLEALLEREPLLRGAVEELDLELLD